MPPCVSAPAHLRDQQLSMLSDLLQELGITPQQLVAASLIAKKIKRYPGERWVVRKPI